MNQKPLKFSNNKTLATAIILLLTLSLVAAVAIQTANADTQVITHKTYLYSSVASSILGVGQDQVLVYWTADMPPDTGEIEGVIAGAFNRAAWRGVSFNVTAPDGTSTIINVPDNQQDSIGGGYIMFAPDQVGTYTVQASFPAQWKNTTLVNGASTPRQYGYPNIVNQFYSAATSQPITFVVQEEPVPLWSESALPNDYWTRPINDASRLWGQLEGNWLAGQAGGFFGGADYSGWQYPAGQAGGTTTRYVYGTGTESSHILWTRPLYLGGLMDARFGDTGYQTGHYQGMDFTAFIMNGRVYYPDRADAYRSIGFNVVDLYTGELLMYVNETFPSFAQIYNYDSPNQHGGYSFLWRSTTNQLGAGNGTVLEMLDGYSLPMRHICYIANASLSGKNVIGNNGEYLWYNIVNYGTASNPKYYLTCWNNTNVLGLTATGPNTGTTYWQWRPEGGGFGGGPGLSNAYIWDGNTGFSFNASIPTPIALSSIINQTGSIQTIRVGSQPDGDGGFVILGTTGQNNEDGNVPGKLWCLSLERGQEGTQLWTTSFTAPFISKADNESSGMFGTYSMCGVYPEDNVILFHSTKQLKYWAIDMKSGQALWETEREPDNNYYSTQYNYWNHTLYTTGYGGVAIAYDMATGKQIWNYTATNVGGESPYGNYPLNIFAICDGKLYMLTGEHSITQPMWRGQNIRCVDATTGEEVWKILGMGADNGAHLTGMYMQMGDGKVVGLNYFDNEIYCFGPGKSATTVSAPQSMQELGTTLTITGTVTDQTQSGRRNTNGLYDFTLAGTPAVSDESMSAWMEYLYMQQNKPTDTIGVPVTVTAIDPNGNFQNVGETVSDMYGNYAIPYTPEVPGTYQILASFAGTKGYGPSSSSTYFTAGDAPTAPPVATSQPTESVADMYFVPAVIGIVIAIVLVGVANVLLLRKRP
ncbi:MAG: PQQ-binding-like beta-propeller repeat protein [Candidatus Bathyarchaeota archaeon]|nr:PQQ-binding-like beta-propeller repeat protein [Candidatus Bathyarchaeota archaeon]